jgi:hypothetical protein
MWRIWWAPNNASRWQMGFNSVFKGLSKHNCCHPAYKNRLHPGPLSLKSQVPCSSQMVANVKFNLEQATKAKRWGRGIVILFL